MTDQKKPNGVNPIAAAVTGAVVGAGVAVAGAVALHDEKNRAKVKKVLGNVKQQAQGYIKEMQKKAQKGKKDARKALKSAAIDMKHMAAHA